MSIITSLGVSITLDDISLKISSCFILTSMIQSYFILFSCVTSGIGYNDVFCFGRLDVIHGADTLGTGGTGNVLLYEVSLGLNCIVFSFEIVDGCCDIILNG